VISGNRCTPAPIFAPQPPLVSITNIILNKICPKNRGDYNNCLFLSSTNPSNTTDLNDMPCILLNVLRKLIFFILASLFILETHAQDKSPDKKKIYKMNYYVDVPVTLGMFGLNFYGFHLLKQKPNLTIDQISSLDKNDIWKFDRSAVQQAYSLDRSERARTISDYGLWTSYCMPFLLFIDRDIRKDWYDIILLYLETQSINLNVYLCGGPVFTERVRPLVYYEETSQEYKLGDEGTTDAFFSGHSSMITGAFFFMAKVYSDYHPELGAKKWFLYAAALIPSAYMGYQRYAGLMHFPTDIVLGAAVGAGVGILIPHLHKITRKNKNLAIVPFTGGYSGMALTLKF